MKVTPSSPITDKPSALEIEGARFFCAAKHPTGER